MRARISVAAFVITSAACGPPPLVMTPLAPPPPTCAIGGCRPVPPVGPAAEPPIFGCEGSASAACGGSSAASCTERALSAWSESPAERGLACIARMFAEACTLDDARACGFAGRLWLNGHGVPEDTARGLAMVVQGCDGGFVQACAVGVRFLGDKARALDVDDAPALRTRLEVEQACLSGQADACYQEGLSTYFGRDSFPRDRARAARAYDRGCLLYDARACNNLGDALAYGEGVARDAERAASLFDKACHLGESLGCANLGYMLESGQGTARDLAKARAMYKDACATGDIYGCLHARMLAATDQGAPRDRMRALAHWTHLCDVMRRGQACAFVGLLYEDGEGGAGRDDAKSLQAMARGCQLGEEQACEWVKLHGED